MGSETQKKRRKGGRIERLGTAAAGTDVPVGSDTPNYTAPASPERVCVIACGALAHEILDIVTTNRLDHIALTCLPAKLHNTPDKIVPAMKEAIEHARKAGFSRLFCGYADCGTGGALDRLLERENVRRLPGAHCYSFFSGVEKFESANDADMRSFFLTDFLARHFDALTWRPLGLDRHPELLSSYFGAYEKVVFLSQRNEPGLLHRAEEIARRLNLSFEHRKTGYGDLAPSLADIPIPTLPTPGKDR